MFEYRRLEDKKCVKIFGNVKKKKKEKKLIIITFFGTKVLCTNI